MLHPNQASVTCMQCSLERTWVLLPDNFLHTSSIFYGIYLNHVKSKFIRETEYEIFYHLISGILIEPGAGYKKLRSAIFCVIFNSRASYCDILTTPTAIERCQCESKLKLSGPSHHIM